MQAICLKIKIKIKIKIIIIIIIIIIQAGYKQGRTKEHFEFRAK